MDDLISSLITALGLVLVFEGILYALFPTRMQDFMARMLESRPEELRNAGLIAAVIGVLIVWLIRG